MPITSESQLNNVYLGLQFRLTGGSAQIATRYSDYYIYNNNPAPNNFASSNFNHTGAETGVFGYKYPSGYKMYLGGAELNISTTWPFNFILYDRLWSCSGFNCATGAVQTITNPGVLPPRDINNTSSGLGCEIWWQANGAITQNTGTRITVTYTNHTGLTDCRATGWRITSANNSGEAMPIYMSTPGVSSIQSLTFSNAFHTSTNFGLIILRRIAEFNYITISKNFDGLSLGFPFIPTGATLSFMSNGTTNVTASLIGKFNFVIDK